MKLIALVDNAAPAMSESDEALFDEITSVFKPVANGLYLNCVPLNNGERWIVPPGLGITKIGIVFDFIAHDFAGLIKSDDVAKVLINNTKALKEYDLLLPISVSTENKIKELVSKSIPTLVTGVIVDDEFFLRGSGEGEASGTAFPERFFVTVAGDNDRKNLEVALKAFGRGGGDFAGVTMLVIGGYDDDAQLRVRSTVGAKELVDWSRVRFLPWVSDQVISETYQRAVASIVPSFIEGFSIPVVETIASGGLALFSNCEAHLELLEGPAFDPHSVEALQALMTSALDPAWRAAMIGRQAGMADRFRFQRIGERVWPEILKAQPRASATKAVKAPQSASQPASQPASQSASLAAAKPVAKARRAPGDRPSILFVTPYPPEPTGVGKLHAEGMPAFMARADVTVATLKAATRPHGPGRHRVIRPKDIDFAEYDRVFYVIGNSLYHTFVHDMLLENGGEAIFHDSRMFEYYLHTRGLDRVAAMASDALGRPIGHGDLDDWARDRRKLPLPMLDEVVAASTRMFVFTKAMETTLRDFYGRDSVVTPLPVHTAFPEELFSPGRILQARGRVGFTSDTLNICTFGGVDPSKGIYESIQVLDQLRQYDRHATLHLVGGVDETSTTNLRNFATSLGVADRLVFHGATSPDRYVDFLLAADLGMQFRKARFGQLSGAVTECIATGLWSIVNESLADAHDAPHFITRVPDTLSPPAIALAILDLLDSQDIRVRDDAVRRAHLQGRSWDDYAAAVLDL